MKYQLTLILCLSPIVIIYIVMKLTMLASAIKTESDYVRKEPFRKRGPYLAKTRMQMLMQRKKSMEIAQIIDDALYQYYAVERGEKVPNWRYIKDAEWWIEYLKSLGMDPRNP